MTALITSKSTDANGTEVVVKFPDGGFQTFRFSNETTEQAILAIQSKGQQRTKTADRVTKLGLFVGQEIDLTMPEVAKVEASAEEVARSDVFAKESELRGLRDREWLGILKDGQAERIAELQAALK